MKVLILASGGDAPGSNKFIAEIYKHFGKNLFACRNGFRGLANGDIIPAAQCNPKKYSNFAGCCIGASRFPEFKEPKVFAKALKNAQQYDAVIILGGNGSKKGVKELAANGVNAIFVPATIDNDVEESEYSIGFHTAVKAVCDAIAFTKPSMQSHSRACIYETMGRYCGKIAENAGMAMNADATITDEKQLNVPRLAKIVKSNAKKHAFSTIVIRENVCDVKNLAQTLQEQSGVEVKTFVVGHLQRGHKPTKAELSYAKRLAHGTIKAIRLKAAPIAIVFLAGKTLLKKF